MKNIIAFCIVMVTSFHAYSLTLINNTGCKFTVQAWCMSDCNTQTLAYVPVTVDAYAGVVTPGSFPPLLNPPAILPDQGEDCVFPNFIAYQFCWDPVGLNPNCPDPCIPVWFTPQSFTVCPPGAGTFWIQNTINFYPAFCHTCIAAGWHFTFRLTGEGEITIEAVP